MKASFPRFDMARDPIRTQWYLKPITKLLSWPAVMMHRPRITRVGTEGLEPPFILLCNHNAFMDVPVATLICHGHHVNSPFWNLHDRGVKPTEAEYSLLLTRDQVREFSVDEINDRIVQAWRKSSLNFRNNPDI